MGAMWAYESLTFGGYWAWDPVENAALVPWLILVAAIHTMLIYKHTGRSLRATYLFVLLSFLLILYSTFLTRSGILGDSSVHAFTDLGMNFQLLLFLLVFVMPALILFYIRYQEIPHIAKEEQISSREFWMHIGSLVLLLSAGSIIVMTSIPVFNKIASLFAGEDKTLFKPLALGEDAEYSYNRIQIFVAIGIGILTAFTQYLKYRRTNAKYFFKKIWWPAGLALSISILILVFGNLNYAKHGNGYLILIGLAVTSSVYAIIANLSYILIGLKGKLKSAGASVAHAGFGFMLLGILISASKKEILSINNSGIFKSKIEGSNENPGENVTLLKGVKTSMDKYWVTYHHDSANAMKPLWYYHIRFEEMDNKNKFTLIPNAFVNYKGIEGLMSNPDVKHYWDHDLFTYITSLPDPEKSKDTTQFEIIKLKMGDSIFYSNGSLILEKIVSKNNIPVPGIYPSDIASIANIKIISNADSIYITEPILINRNGQLFSLPDSVNEEHLVIQLRGIEGEFAELGIKTSTQLSQTIEFITVKVLKFPFINLLWIGTVIMIIGLIMSIIKRFF